MHEILKVGHLSPDPLFGQDGQIGNIEEALNLIQRRDLGVMYDGH